MPEAVIIAGANGAGKTTFARQVVPTLYPGIPFLNVDEIQVNEPAFAHPIAAGRELLRRLEEAEIRKESFAIETTLFIGDVCEANQALARPWLSREPPFHRVAV